MIIAKPFNGGLGKNMCKAAHPSGSVGSSNSHCWRGEQLCHHGDGVWEVVCAFCGISWFLTPQSGSLYVQNVRQHNLKVRLIVLLLSHIGLHHTPWLIVQICLLLDESRFLCVLGHGWVDPMWDICQCLCCILIMLVLFGLFCITSFNDIGGFRLNAFLSFGLSYGVGLCSSLTCLFAWNCWSQRGDFSGFLAFLICLGVLHLWCWHVQVSSWGWFWHFSQMLWDVNE